MKSHLKIKDALLVQLHSGNLGHLTDGVAVISDTTVHVVEGENSTEVLTPAVKCSVSQGDWEMQL